MVKDTSVVSYVTVRCSCGGRVAERATLIGAEGIMEIATPLVSFRTAAGPLRYRENRRQNPDTISFEGVVNPERPKKWDEGHEDDDGVWLPHCEECGKTYTLIAIKSVLRYADSNGKRNVRIYDAT